MYVINMDDIEQNLANWSSRLFPKIPVSGLYSRSPVAHKWKAPFRALVLREATFWRENDLMCQAYYLQRQGYGLGARILLRSGFETLATIVYVNILISKVTAGTYDFHEFCDETRVLLLGTRNNSQLPDARNILTVLKRCEDRYPGISKIYGELSESAHPNYEGLLVGYSETNFDEQEVNFANHWMDIYGDKNLEGIRLCMGTFQHEYDTVFSELFVRLEKWLEENDDVLEAKKLEIQQ